MLLALFPVLDEIDRIDEPMMLLIDLWKSDHLALISNE
jgi:hypothetical protein